MVNFLLPTFRNGPSLRLDGGRVYLRAATLDDWKNWSDLREASRDFLVPWEPTWPPDCLTRDAFSRRLRRHQVDWHNDAAYNLLIFRQQDHAIVGGLSINQIRRGVAQTGTLGYWTGQPYVRQGYMFEATQLLLAHAFGQLVLHRVEAGCVPTNEPSAQLLLKLGFTEEGYARQYLRINGKWEDHRLFGLLREDFLKP